MLACLASTLLQPVCPFYVSYPPPNYVFTGYGNYPTTTTTYGRGLTCLPPVYVCSCRHSLESTGRTPRCPSNCPNLVPVYLGKVHMVVDNENSPTDDFSDFLVPIPCHTCHTIPYHICSSYLAPGLLSAMSMSPCVYPSLCLCLSVRYVSLPSAFLPSVSCSNLLPFPYCPPVLVQVPVPVPRPHSHSPSLFPNSLIPLCLFFYCNKISHFLSSLAPPSLSPSPPSYSVLEGFLLFLTGFPVVRAPFFHSA